MSRNSGTDIRSVNNVLVKPTLPAPIKATLNDIGTEELAHLEIVGALVHQLTKGVSPDVLKKAGLGAYYTDHGMCLETILEI